MAKVNELAGAITNGLVKFNVLVNVILKYALVALRRTQYFPPSVVAVEEGNVNALNPELLK
jgi:hypothetical protein